MIHYLLSMIFFPCMCEDTDCIWRNLSDAKTSIVYGGCGIAFLSFVLLVITVALTIWSYCRFNGFREYIEMLILILSIFLMLMCFCESFQWLVIFTGKNRVYNALCIVIAFTREYLMIAIMINATCIATHLCLQICRPKCLQVIGDERKRIYRRVMWLYLLLQITVPFLFVPWPFIRNLYGVDETLCWICNDKSAEGLVIKIASWYMWPFAFILFIMISLLATSIILCKRAAVKCNCNVCSLLIVMTVLILAMPPIAVDFFYMQQTSQRRNELLDQLLGDLPISVVWLLSSVILMGRIICRMNRMTRRRHPLNRIQVNALNETSSLM